MEGHSRLSLVGFLLAPPTNSGMVRLMENGLVNLAAIVGLLILCIGIVPVILLLGTRRAPAGDKSQD